MTIAMKFKRAVMQASSVEEIDAIREVAARSKQWTEKGRGDTVRWAALKDDAMRVLNADTVVQLSKAQFQLIEAGRGKDESRPTLTMVEVSEHGAVATDGHVLIVVEGIGAPQGVYRVDKIGMRLYSQEDPPRYPDWLSVTKGMRCSEPSSVVEWGTMGDVDACRLRKGTIVNKDYLTGVRCYNGDGGKIYEAADGCTHPLHFTGEWKGVSYWGRLMPMHVLFRDQVRLTQLEVGDKFTRHDMPFPYEVCAVSAYGVTYKLLDSDKLIVAEEDGHGSFDWNMIVQRNNL